MTELIKLHGKLGLHQELIIIYVVDGYLATLYFDGLEGQLLKKVSSEVCETIYLSLLSLESKL